MEYFDVVDEKGNPTGEIVERSVAHATGKWHRTAHIWLLRKVDNRIEILLQKRAKDKDSFPGCYDTSAAGHVQACDDVFESALRELNEELGIQAAKEDLLYAGYFRIQYATEFYGKPFIDNEVSFVYIYNKQIDISKLKLQKEEVDSVQWFDLKEAYQMSVEKNPITCVPVSELNVLKKYLEENEVTIHW